MTGCAAAWQVGNSGMFRPEMLRPMGLPEDVNVIAWGLGLERYAHCCTPAALIVCCNTVQCLLQTLFFRI